MCLFARPRNLYEVAESGFIEIALSQSLIAAFIFDIFKSVLQ